MIEELSITDLGVITSARLEPGPGLSVITGETGAGKTMVLTGLALILGQQADTTMIRPGADSATAEGRLVPPADHPALTIAQDAGALLDDGALLITRTMRDGRSRAHLGGRSVPAGLLAEIGESLVTVHGQSDQLRLREAAHQRQALDEFAGHTDTVAAHAKAHRDRRAAQADLERWDADDGARAVEIERLQRATERIDALELHDGEDGELRALAERLGNVEELRIAAAGVHGALAGSDEADGGGVLSGLQRAMAAADAGSGFDEVMEAWSTRLQQASYLLADVSSEAASYGVDLDADPQRLEAAHQRRAAIAELLREYLPQHDPHAGDPADALIEFAQVSSARLADLSAPGAGRDALVKRLQETTDAAAKLAKAIGERRAKAATAMAKAVGEELSELAMPNATLHIELPERSEPAEYGNEDVRFLLSPHPDAPARPLGKGASGGELSRIMLAIEVALARSGGGKDLPTFVFDEVDAGVGGKAATAIGRRLAELAQHTQVIVITHLAQVAAFASDHIVVTKRTASVTSSDIQHVQGKAREAELARMLSGEEESDVALRHAADLLSRALMRP